MVVILDLLLLYFIGRRRSLELSTIEKVICDIRNNRINSADEIRLDKELLNLESEIKQMYLRSKNDVEYLKRLEKVRTEFLGNVSHELRTPIFAIQGFLETLLDGAIDDDMVNRKFLEKANIHTQNLNNLLNDLIDISMIESGQMHLSFRYFNIGEFLVSVAQELEPYAEKKNIDLKIHPVRENLKLFGDKSKLKQVLVNLIQNAIKYTEEGEVEIIVEEHRNYAILTVRDSGVGISDRDLPRIFERFYRVDKGRSRAVGGTGLGLAIVKHIVEAHGSKVEVKSEPGRGSEFSFRLKK